MINAMDVGSRLSVLLGCLLMLCVGCGPGNPDGRISVEVTATWNGEPISDGYIMFVSTSGQKSSGGAIVDGSFKLTTQKGVPQGTYKVEITGNRPSGKKVRNSDFPDQFEEVIEQYIPRRFNEQSELKLEVSGPLEPLTYDLKK